MSHILILYMSLRCRYTFLNFGRYGSYSEKSYRNHFGRSFDFLGFNRELVLSKCSSRRVLAFDPSYLPKSGKKTPHLDRYWSGCAGKKLKGLEIGVLSLIDLEAHTAMPLEAVQSPDSQTLRSQDQSLVDHYAELIIKRKTELEQLSSHLVADGYFAKKKFVDAICEQTKLALICKLRKDADLRYLYQGPAHKGRGRPRKYDGKVEVKALDPDKVELAFEDQYIHIYSAIVYAKQLKRRVKMAYVQFLNPQAELANYAIFFSTDLHLDAEQIFRIYQARFQIEFLIRDAKQHTGLAHCQARDENKLHFHFNTSLTSVGIAKALTYPHKIKERFSMADWKTHFHNHLMLQIFFNNFQIDPNHHKIKPIYHRLLNFGRIAA